MDLSALDLSACQWIDGGQEDGWEEEEVVRSVGHELAGEKVPSVQSRSGDGAVKKWRWRWKWWRRLDRCQWTRLRRLNWWSRTFSSLALLFTKFSFLALFTKFTDGGGQVLFEVLAHLLEDLVSAG